MVRRNGHTVRNKTYISPGAIDCGQNIPVLVKTEIGLQNIQTVKEVDNSGGGGLCSDSVRLKCSGNMIVFISTKIGLFTMEQYRLKRLARIYLKSDYKR